MSPDVNTLRDKMSRIKDIQKELSLRFALFQHVSILNTHMEMMTDLQRIDNELEQSRVAIQQCEEGSEEEECYLERLHTLEDQRFLLLSALNGDDISGYRSP